MLDEWDEPPAPAAPARAAVDEWDDPPPADDHPSFLDKGAPRAAPEETRPFRLPNTGPDLPGQFQRNIEALVGQRLEGEDRDRGPVETFLRKGSQAVSSGFVNPIAAKVSSLISGQPYQDALKGINESDAAAEARNPVAGAVGTVVGTGLQLAAPLPIPKGTSTAGKIAHGAGTGAVLGGAAGAGSALTEGGGAGDALAGAIPGAIGGAAVGAAIPAAGALVNGAVARSAARSRGDVVDAIMDVGVPYNIRSLVKNGKAAGVLADEAIARVAKPFTVPYSLTKWAANTPRPPVEFGPASAVPQGPPPLEFPGSVAPSDLVALDGSGSVASRVAPRQAAAPAPAAGFPARVRPSDLVSVDGALTGAPVVPPPPPPARVAPGLAARLPDRIQPSDLVSVDGSAPVPARPPVRPLPDTGGVPRHVNPFDEVTAPHFTPAERAAGARDLRNTFGGDIPGVTDAVDAVPSATSDIATVAGRKPAAAPEASVKPTAEPAEMSPKMAAYRQRLKDAEDLKYAKGMGLGLEDYRAMMARRAEREAAVARDRALASVIKAAQSGADAPALLTTAEKLGLSPYEAAAVVSKLTRKAGTQ